MFLVQLSSSNDFYSHSVDTVASHYEDEPLESLEEIEAQTIGNLLPDDDDDLLAGVIDKIESIVQPSGEDGIEDLDLFSSVGGMDLGDDTSSGGLCQSEFSGSSNGQLTGANMSVNGEHPYGEHPSRTLFVRNINSNAEDLELQTLFEVCVRFYELIVLLVSDGNLVNLILFFSRFYSNVISMVPVKLIICLILAAIWRYPCSLYNLQTQGFRNGFIF